MNYKLRTNKAFTLLELVVAIAILAMVLSFAGVIFKVSIESYRTAIANAEIMRKMRAITDQLNTDFKDIRKDAPLLIRFRQNPANPSQRYDQIMFFADGDFQSTQLYDGNPPADPLIPAPAGQPVRGNVARIYYGQAGVNRTRPDDFKPPWQQQINKKRVLARSQHILTSDPSIFHWFADFNDFKMREVIHNRYPNNDFYEHDRLSLSEWKAVGWEDYRDQIIPACFKKRPQFDIYDPNTFHKLMSESVGNFAVQWAYWDPGPDLSIPLDDQYRWFPSDDPDGLAAPPDDSHFLLMDPPDPDPVRTEFGVSFNTPGMRTSGWHRIEDGYVIYRWPPGGYNRKPMTFSPDFFPDALKFTFTLYDSKGIIENGRRFTHIVYIGE
ncbi:MAG: type II secretion system protein [Desulfobacterales bacterium]|nr:type II secretion system protein [Desulfobacterales bacterium]